MSSTFNSENNSDKDDDEILSQELRSVKIRKFLESDSESDNQTEVKKFKKEHNININDINNESEGSITGTVIYKSAIHMFNKTKGVYTVIIKDISASICVQISKIDSYSDFSIGVKYKMIIG